MHFCRSLLQRAFSKRASFEETLKAELHFYVSYLQKDMIAFDVGANCGDMTLLFSNLIGRNGMVHAFEPGLSAFGKLSELARIADKGNITLNNLAVTDSTGTALLHVYDDQYSTWNTLAPRDLEQYGIDIRVKSRERVATVSVDDYCSKHGISRIDLLKIDVEGAEYQVLLGAQQMLSRHAVGCCVFEYGATTFDMGNHPDQIERLLTDLGYEIRNLIRWNPVFPGRTCAQEAQYSLHSAQPKT